MRNHRRAGSRTSDQQDCGGCHSPAPHTAHPHFGSPSCTCSPPPPPAHQPCIRGVHQGHPIERPRRALCLGGVDASRVPRARPLGGLLEIRACPPRRNRRRREQGQCGCGDGFSYSGGDAVMLKREAWLILVGCLGAVTSGMTRAAPNAIVRGRWICGWDRQIIKPIAPAAHRLASCFLLHPFPTLPAGKGKTGSQDPELLGIFRRYQGSPQGTKPPLDPYPGSGCMGGVRAKASLALPSLPVTRSGAFSPGYDDAGRCSLPPLWRGNEGGTRDVTRRGRGTGFHVGLMYRG